MWQYITNRSAIMPIKLHIVAILIIIQKPFAYVIMVSYYQSHFTLHYKRP